jgi:hypothetical protein
MSKLRVEGLPGGDARGINRLQSERTQGFTAGPVYGRAKCLPVLGSFKT